ncbi:hypothetical protein CBS101457_003386 [Exobasidium rhododendri]|nr:hypothetical protein CBS101457_003386 [Exobasidium rhododendri]
MQSASESASEPAFSLADKVAASCLAQYKQLPQRGAKPTIRGDGKYEWTILAGVVLQIGEGYHCISLCTGVKTLPYNSLSENGDLLHDSHAEVLARRAARRWLLNRLADEQEAKTGAAELEGVRRVFTKDSDSAPRYRLVTGVLLHLYCSKLPCGDMSTSSLLEECIKTGHADRKAPRRIVTLRGRSALSDPHLHLRTKPGRPQSMPSISMSCTDKLAMWSMVGMQGSLLSRWVAPIFFKTIVIGVDSTQRTKSYDEFAQECEMILQEKRRMCSHEGDGVRVLSTTLPFASSREITREKLLISRPDARVEGPSEEQDLVPAAGSIVWIRGEKVENIIEGKRQGAGLPKDKSLPLAPLARSKLSKIDFFLLALHATSILAPGQVDTQPGGTYYQAKHDCTDDNIAFYRRTKEELQGSISTEEQRRAVDDVVVFALLRVASVGRVVRIV